MQPDTNLLFAAHAVLTAINDGPVYGHDRSVLLLRVAVQAFTIADLTAELGRAHAEADEARETAAALRAELEEATATIVSLRQRSMP